MQGMKFFFGCVLSASSIADIYMAPFLEAEFTIKLLIFFPILAMVVLGAFGYMFFWSWVEKTKIYLKIKAIFNKWVYGSSDYESAN